MPRFSRNQSEKRLRLESLEARQLLDGTSLMADPASLVAADDSFTLSKGVEQAVLDVLRNDPLAQISNSTKIVSLGETRRDDAKPTISTDGKSILYDAPHSPYFTDHFTYTIEDAAGNRSEATVRIKLDSRGPRMIQIPGVSGNDNYRIFENEPSQSLSVLDNDYRRNSSTANFRHGSIFEVTRPSLDGEVEISADGRSLEYRPAENVSGTDTFHYKVRNSRGQIGTFQVAVGIRPGFQLTATPRQFFDVGRGPFTISPSLENRHSVQSDLAPRITEANVPNYAGTVSIGENANQLIYQPAEGFRGELDITYTVRYGAAAHQTATSTIQVSIDERFHAVNDRFQVFPSSKNNTLKPLENDLGFGSQDRHVGLFSTAVAAKPMNLVIAYVHRGSHGGQMEISDDGETLSYTPAEGFRGEETFRYLLRDTNRGARDWGEITVTVTDEVATNSGLLPQFSSRAELVQLLLQRAIAAHQANFGRTVRAPLFRHYPYYLNTWADVDVTTGFAADQPSTNVVINSTDGSADQTNTQVEGVDEADIVETDGRYLYTFSEGKLVIVDVEDPADPQLTSFTKLTGKPSEMYLQGDRLTILHRSVSFSSIHGETSSFGDALTVLDISDRTNPHVLERTEIEGSIVSSRAIGDHVYLVVNKHIHIPSLEWRTLSEEPSAEPSENADTQPTSPISTVDRLTVVADYYPGNSTSYQVYQYETQAEYLARVRDTLVDNTLPSYRTYNASGELIDSGLLTEPEQLYKLDGDGNKIQSLVTFNTGDDAPGPLATTSLMTDQTDLVYLSQSAAYLFSSAGGSTTIHKLILAEDGTTELVAAGKVEGVPLNQFSADEYEGRLRIATTSVSQGRSSSNVFILEQVGEQLEVVGSVTGIAPRERIFAVRFLGERAFVVTFRQVDPLFALDLSDPTSPTLEGELKIPGFSDYLHPIAEDYLIGVGSSGTRRGNGQPQVSLFYVGDLSNPQRVDVWTLDTAKRMSTEVSRDHHAFAYFADQASSNQGFFTLPVSGTERVQIDSDDDGILDRWSTEVRRQMLAFEVNTDEIGGGTIEQVATIDHPHAARRSVRIDNALLTLSEKTLLVHDFADLEQEAARLHLGTRAVDDAFTLLEDSGANRLDVLANDLPSDLPDSRRVISVTQPSGDIGEVTITEDGNAVAFTPAEDFFGSAVFHYTISDELRGEQTAKVRLTIENTPDDPVAVDDTFTVESGKPTTINVWENDENLDDTRRNYYSVIIDDTPAAIDIDIDTPLLVPVTDSRLVGDAVWWPPYTKDLTITELGTPTAGGMVSLNEYNQTVEYTPAAGFTGEETFTYQITNRAGLTSEATVTVRVEDQPTENTGTGSNDPGVNLQEATVFYGPFVEGPIYGPLAP